MAQETINVGTAPNDGLGDPLRTAFIKTNNNFNQLFATAGITGIANGTSNVAIPQANGNVTISSAGTANVLIVTGTGVNVAGTLNSSGLATLSNLSVTGTVVSIGTIQSISDVTAVNLGASANITAAGYLFGDGGYISNVTAVSNLAVTLIANGTTSVATTGSGANVAVSIGGISNVAVFATTGEYITGILSASGNITGGNILTGGLISATSTITSAANIAGSNFVSGGLILSVGNISGGNLLTGGLISATSTITSAANITGGNLLTGGLISATANITGGNLLTTGLISATSTITSAANITGGNLLTGGLISATANITGGNLLTTGIVSATGNITGSYILGNGSQLTGVDATQIINGTSNAKVVSSGGNIAVGIGGTSNVAVFATTGEYITGVLSASGNITGGNILTSGLISATGNVTGGNILTAGLISATGNISGNVLTVNSGNTTTAIINAGGNAVGNIGSSSNYFNQVFAQATTALYADLAEIYSADAEYAAGTVVSFGGSQEVTKSTVSGDARVAGVISDRPSYLMNSALQAEHRATVALTGRVPTRVIGPVVKGDMMVSTGDGRAQASATPAMGTVIGKALENFLDDSGTIEIVVGRM